MKPQIKTKLKTNIFRSIYPLLLTGLFVTAGSNQLAFGQQTQIPTQASPGLLTPSPSDIFQESEEQKKHPLKKDEEVEQVDIDVPEQAPIVQLEGGTFMVNRIDVTGNTLVSNENIRAIVAPYEGRELSLDELGKMVTAINKLYYQDGYYTAQAYVPPQDIDQGTVEIRIVEGTIGTMSVSGNKYYKASVIADSLEQRPGDSLNIVELEKNLNLVNQRGMFRVKASLSPGEETGETDIRIDVMEPNKWQISPTFDNQGRPTIGMYRWGVDVANNNVLGYGDRFQARYLQSVQSEVAMGSYTMPLNNGIGTEVGASFGFSHVDVDLRVNQSEIDGYAYNYGLFINQPLNSSRTLSMDAGMNWRRITSESNSVLTSVDDIASMQFGFNLNKPDRYGRTFARLQTTVAPDWFGANQKFWKNNLIVTRIFRLPKSNILILRGQGQLTPDSYQLPSAELFQIGGAFSVRGFSEGLLAGDNGVSFTAEHRWPIPGLRHASPWLADRVQGVSFFDFGYVWQNNRSTRIATNPNANRRTLLVGAGVGLRATLTQYLQGFVDFGFGLTDRGGELATKVEPYNQPSVRVHFGVRSNLIPEGYKRRSENVTPIYAKGEAPAQTDSEQPQAQPEAAPEESTDAVQEESRTIEADDNWTLGAEEAQEDSQLFEETEHQDAGFSLS